MFTVAIKIYFSKMSFLRVIGFHTWVEKHFKKETCRWGQVSFLLGRKITSSHL